MKKSIKITSGKNQKGIIKNAIQSSENEQLDLYQAVFGGAGASCSVVAVDRLQPESQVSAYDKHDTFLRSVI